MLGQTNGVRGSGGYTPSNVIVQSLAARYAELQDIPSHQRGPTTVQPILRMMEILLGQIDRESHELPAGDKTLVATIRSEVQLKFNGNPHNGQTVWGDRPLGGAVYGLHTVEGYDL